MMRTLLILTLLVANLTACTTAPSIAPVGGTPQTQAESPVDEPRATAIAAATATLPATVAAITVAPATATPPPTTAPAPTVAPTAPPPPTAATAAAAFPTGVFTNAVGWTYDFKDDGRYIVQMGGDSAVGIYTVSGKQVVFSESTATYSDCVGDAKEGTYTWTYDGKALRFEMLADRCGMRQGAFASGPLLKKP